MRTITRAAFVAALVLPAAVLIPAAASSAASTSATPNVSCSGYGCDGQWPDVSGCASTAITAESTDIYDGSTLVGRVDLRYSTACRTVWGRILSYYDNGTGEDAQVWRNSDHAYYLCDTNVYSSTLGAYSCYTQMLYDGAVTSFAEGFAPSPSGNLDLKGVTSSY